MQEDEERQPARKRRRVAVACDERRRRKICCDGAQPLCSFCGQHGLTCVCHKGPQRVQVPYDYLQSLIRQVHDLKRTKGPLVSQHPEGTSHDPAYDGYGDQHAAGDGSESAFSIMSPSTCGPTQNGLDISPSVISTQHGTRVRLTSTVDATPHEVARLEDTLSIAKSVTDTIVCAGSPPPASGGSYFGASSTPAFLDVVQAMAASSNGNRHYARIRRRGGPRPGEKHTAATAATPPSRATTTYNNKSCPSMGVKSRFLPPRWTADHLVDTYFSHVCITFTVLQSRRSAKNTNVCGDPRPWSRNYSGCASSMPCLLLGPFFRSSAGRRKRVACRNLLCPGQGALRP